MDVSVRRDGELAWCVEVKVRPSQIVLLLAKLETYARSVDLAEPDRGKDALRKAKYLVRHRPPHLSIVGGEERRHFDVHYPGSNSFALVPRASGPEDLRPRPRHRTNLRD